MGKWRNILAMLPAITLCCGLLLPQTLFGQTQAQANAVLNPAHIESGDTFALRVLVAGTAVAPKRVSFASWQKQFPTDNVLSRSKWARSGIHWVQQFTLISFDTASVQLPPLTVFLHLGDTIQTNPIDLTITTMFKNADVKDMAAIRDIRREPILWYDHWPWAVGALAVFALLAWWLRRQGRRKKPVPVPVPLTEPPPPADHIALQKLAALEQQKPWMNGNLLAYYAELSLIVREYLENRYSVPALESTTREITAFLKKTDFPDTQKKPLNFLLQQTDLVKYAEMEPPKSYHEEALEKAKTLVLATT
ncbi:MAG: hypothetical protein H6574_18605 [Lewinellaceae bacterium]|nr:hypothetical protein [Lewinellaceae bacterium]MCB9333085.1 hypothetical protein [Lewinellaceae bacterium]